MMPLPDKISELPEAVRQALEVALAAEQNKDKTAARGLKRGASSADLWDDAVKEAPKVRVHTRPGCQVHQAHDEELHEGRG